MKTKTVCSTAYVKMYLKLSGINEEELLAGTKLQSSDLEHREFIEVSDHIALMHNLARHASSPAWAATLGSQLNINSHGSLGFAALSAPTLGEALQVMADYHSTRLASFSAELGVEGQRARIVIHLKEGDALYQRWISESVLKILQSLILTIVGDFENHQLSFHFASSAPEYLGELESIFNTGCDFDAEFTGIEFPASWWEMPSSLYDEGSYRSNLSKCLERSALAVDTDSFVHKVECLLKEHFDQAVSLSGSDHGLPDLSYLADTLCLGERTLIRRLASEKSSYKRILARVRQQYAESLLLKGTLSVADVGFVLGYSDPANFNRAFRKWLGMSPALWRRERTVD
ncbi:AraC family transcriptional regulator [Endozoicomonas arenosclerae]|uniref:AraC family transcriptional regulator n=1 Tax=Endozoicomonas arenosclerae TaxID=1633495 RepID=UPI000B0B8F4C|nr:AraC family transcriptional regulator [Endozoicomonas arenosclerae]